MPTYSSSIEIDAPISAVFHFHDDTRNLVRITPPNIHVEFSTKGSPGKGLHVYLTVTQFKVLRTRWHVTICDYQEPTLMTDEQVEGPFRKWKQTRLFEQTATGTLLTDIVEYELPFGLLGRIADALVVGNQIKKMFQFRQRRTKQILETALL